MIIGHVSKFDSVEYYCLKCSHVPMPTCSHLFGRPPLGLRVFEQWRDGRSRGDVNVVLFPSDSLSLTQWLRCN